MRLLAVGALLLWSAGLAWPQAAGSSASPDGGAQPHNGSVSSVRAARFAAADLAGKLAIIDAAASLPATTQRPLLRQAIDYLAANLEAFRGNADAARLAVRVVGLIASADDAQAAGAVWQLFHRGPTAQVRLAAMACLAVVARGNRDLIGQMNQWLSAQNLLERSGSATAAEIVDGCIRALGRLADGSSFGVLLAAAVAGYGTQVTNDARDALERLGGDRAKQLREAVVSGRDAERSAALEMAMRAKELATAQKASVAQAALGAALSAEERGQGSAAEAARLRFESVGYLENLAWTPATGVLLENFDLAVLQYRAGSISAARLVESANALASTGAHEAAVRLSLFLSYVNTMTNQRRPFDPSVTLAVIEDLGKLRDPVAYDNLFAVHYLDYPDSIKEAAGKAVRNLAQ